MIKAYKVFDPNWKCRGFQYQVGKTYKHDGEIKLCANGFHACKRLIDCFNYQSFNPENKVAEVECFGKVIEGDDKLVCSEIIIIKELDWYTVLDLCNTGKQNTGNWNSGDWNSGDWNPGNWNSGNWNSGHRNSGNWNSGHRNSGDWNSGDWNSGDWNPGNSNSGHRNSGDWNSGNWNSGNWNSGNWNSGNWNSCENESGYFNSKFSDIVRVFNKFCKRVDWDKADKPDFIYFDLTQWVDSNDMTDDEKEQHSDYEISGGYFKRLEYKEAFRQSWDKASKEDREKLEKLPNFDWDVFTEISGIDKPEEER